MNIDVRLFAGARQRVGRERISITLEPPATVGDLRQALGRAFPELAALLPRAMFATETSYLVDSTSLEAIREIACIPPVSGG